MSFLVAALTTFEASALVWPDVPDRVERGLAAADPNTRRVAARELQTLGPARGAPLVIRALSDTDDEVKLAAADSAIRLRVAAAIDPIIPWLNARDPRLRKKACEVARALPNPRVVAPLARTLGDQDQEVRQAAAEALGHQMSADAVAPLLGRLDDSSPAVRIEIASSLARLGDPRAVVPLVGKVQDSAAEVRQAVARALGDLGDPRAAQALVLQLRDNNNEVRREALHALGRLRSADAVDAIAPFATERVAPLRHAALAALGKIATKEAVRVLVGALGTAEDATGGLEPTPVREALVAAGPAAIPQLRAVLEGQPTPQVATSAAWVLGELRATSEARTVMAATRRGSLPAAAALHALAGVGDANTAVVVLEFMRDASAVVRAEALQAAASLLDPAHPDGRAVEPLAAALRDPRPSPAERAQMARLLGRTGAPRAAPVLVDLTNARDPSLKLAAIDALGMLGPAGADDALLAKLDDPDATVRLHAAIALGDAGGARARDELLAKLDVGDEVDRTAVLTALGGVMARVPSEAAVHRLVRALELAAGPERDALLLAVGRAPLAPAMRELAAVARGPDLDDRRTVATVLAAHAAQPATRADALQLAKTMLADADASVRAQAAWTLGAFGDVSALPPLAQAVRGADVDTAVNAAGAIGRVTAKARRADLAAPALCPLLTDARPYVRVNALAGIALVGGRCGDGALVRKALAEDPNDVVRAAAALALGRASGPAREDDKRALERCAASDRAGTVARRCRALSAPPRGAHSVEIYVVSDGSSTPRPRTAYALSLADGTLRVGTSDRRGALFEPAAPEGDVSLERPSALSRP